MPLNSPLNLPTNLKEWQPFLEEYKLSSEYLEQAEAYFVPVINDIIALAKESKRPILVGINGCQGSGKSTLASYIVKWFDLNTDQNSISISIDDFYYDQTHRKLLAAEIHPLFETRGVPGTHDLELANNTLDALISKNKTIAIPRFNKADDNPYPAIDWPTLSQPVDIIIIEGWCCGSLPESDTDLQAPINELEKTEDSEGIWRTKVNSYLANEYQGFFSRFDFWVMLKCPDFDSVFNWRLEQEQKLANKNGLDYENFQNCHTSDQSERINTSANKGIMSKQEIQRFVQYFQRITESNLKHLPSKMNWVLELDKNRSITNTKQSKG